MAADPVDIPELEIRELAERVLFGASLDEKLVRVGRLTDQDPGPPRDTPTAPGRPAALSLGRWRDADDTERVAFTDVRALEGEQERGLVLHFFANHELLAAELMALVLLKFPDAPARFRRGVAQTLKDEQEHVLLYLARMRRIGVEFGQIPVSDFFWRAIAPMPSPMDFVARLSLTLEQANLDYAPHYGRLFAQLGDSDTEALLGRIYKDEIGHVKLGLNWFNTWRAPSQSEWASFQQALGIPLSPSRAKGIGTFNREGRRQAGIPEAFIDELEVFTRSHGRCPDLWWFNPLCDLAAGRGAAFTPSAPVRDLAQDLATVPALLAAPEDVVVVPQRPSLAFLREWKAAGLAMPEWVAWEPGAAPLPETLAERKLTELRPWGWAPDSAAALQPLAPRLPAGSTAPAQRWSQRRRRLYAKSWSAAWLGEVVDELRTAEGDWVCGPEVVGLSCASEADVERALAAGFAAGWQRAVVKADHGTAGGQHMLVEAPPAAGFMGVAAGGRVADAGDAAGGGAAADGSDVAGAGAEAATREAPHVGNAADTISAARGALAGPAARGGWLREHECRWLARALQDAGAAVVEPWLDRVLDLSAHYDVEADGTVRCVGVTRFLTDGRGRFQGVVVHDMVAGLDTAAKRFLYGEGRDQRRLSRLFQRLGESLQARLAEPEAAAEFTGPIGVDALVYRDAADGALRLKPIVEVNPRYTMGRVRLALARRVLAGRTAVWRLWRVQDVMTAGFADSAAWAAHLRERLPLEMVPDGRQISRGAVFTNEPAAARGVVGVLLVAQSLAELQAAAAPLAVLS